MGAGRHFSTACTQVQEALASVLIAHISRPFLHDALYMNQTKGKFKRVIGVTIGHHTNNGVQRSLYFRTCL